MVVADLMDAPLSVHLSRTFQGRRGLLVALASLDAASDEVVVACLLCSEVCGRVRTQIKRDSTRDFACRFVSTGELIERGWGGGAKLRWRR